MRLRSLAAAVILTVGLLAPAQALGQDPTPSPPAIPSGWSVEYGETHPESPKALGSTSRHHRRIWLRHDASVGILAHEAGHAWDAAKMDVRERVAWADRRELEAWKLDPSDPGRRDFDWRRPDLPWGERPSEVFASDFQACAGHGWHHGKLAAPSRDDCEVMREMLTN